MSLHSISIMVIAPLIVAVGGVLLLTPKDILRQSVIPGTVETARAVTVATPKAPVVKAATIEVVAVASQEELRPASLVVVPSSVTATAVDEEVDRRWITASGLNMRVGPSKNTQLIASLPFGTPVIVLETSGTWAHVEAADGVSGWLSTNFLTDRDPSRSD